MARIIVSSFGFAEFLQRIVDDRSDHSDDDNDHNFVLSSEVISSGRFSMPVQAIGAGEFRIYDRSVRRMIDVLDIINLQPVSLQIEPGSHDFTITSAVI